MNQCDGCRAGIPVDENDNHRMGKPGEYPDLMACTKERYAEHDLQRASPATREARLEEALRHILWVKDCGIDGDEGDGLGWRNYPAQERDSMYEIAKAALDVNDFPTKR